MPLSRSIFSATSLPVSPSWRGILLYLRNFDVRLFWMIIPTIITTKRRIQRSVLEEPVIVDQISLRMMVCLRSGPTETMEMGAPNSPSMKCMKEVKASGRSSARVMPVRSHFQPGRVV